MNIGFDLDNIFVSHPPLVPVSVIRFLYGEKANGKLSYRVPGKFEQWVRIISHSPLFRPAIKQNIQYIKQIKKTHATQLFLISSRFGFLEPQTNRIIHKYELQDVFNSMDFNFKNLQPHIFKEMILEKKHINRFVDDDLPLLRYLSKKLPKTTFFWFNSNTEGKISENIYAITKLEQMMH